MAIDYSLDLGTTMSRQQVAYEMDRVGHELGLFAERTTAELLLGDGSTTRRGTWIRIIDAKPRPWDAVIQDLGFTPTVWVALRLDNLGDSIEQTDDVLVLVTNLLERVPGDAVMHFQTEVIWLLRKDGELLLSERADMWSPKRLAAVRQPYRRETHAFKDEPDGD